jgi:hypothetical protein
VVLVTSYFRYLASAPKVHWQAGAAAPALEQEPKLLPGFPIGDVGYRVIRGAVGLGYRFTVQADPATRPKGVVRFYC